MADALVFGGSNGLVSMLADGLANALRVPERYQHAPNEVDRPGIAICTDAGSFVAGGPMLVYADDEKPGDGLTDSNRASALGQLAEEVAAGRCVAVLASKAEAKRWLDHLAEAGLVRDRPLKRMMICGEPGTGKTTLAAKLAGPLGLPVASADDLITGQHASLENEERGRAAPLEDVLARHIWLAESAQWRSAYRIASVTDCIIYLEHSLERVAQQKIAPGDRPLTWKEKAAISAVEHVYPKANERRIHTKLSEIAHLAPAFEIRNDAELESVTAGFLRGAARRT